MNKLDVIERSIGNIQTSLSSRELLVKDDVLSMVRRRLLEYVFRGGLMEITVVQSQLDKKVTIKSLQAAVAHFEKAAFELHAVDASLQANQQCEHDEVEGQALDEEDVEAHAAFTLSVPVATYQALAKGELTWVVRHQTGTNMTKRLRVGAIIEFKSNKNRLIASVANVIAESSLEAVVSSVLATGESPGRVALAATTKEQVTSTLKNTLVFGANASSSGEGSVLAFQVSVAGSRSQEAAAEENVGDVPADASKAVRPLMVRPSDEVDLCSQGVRDKWRSVVQFTKKHSDDITQLDGFGRLVTEALRNQFGGSVLPALSYVSNVVMRAVPRELDYIVANEGQPVKGVTMDLNSLRAQLADRLLTLCVSPDAIALARNAASNFQRLLEEYSFPKYTLDIDCFATDMLAAASAEAQAASAASAQTVEAYAARVTRLQEELEAARAEGRNVDAPMKDAPSSTAPMEVENTSAEEPKDTQSATTPSNLEGAAATQTKMDDCGHDAEAIVAKAEDGILATVTDESLGTPARTATGDSASEHTGKDHPSSGAKTASLYRCQQLPKNAELESCLQGATEVDNRFAQQATDCAIAATLELWCELLRPELSGYLTQRSDGGYDAKQRIPKGELCIPFRGKVVRSTTSVFKKAFHGAFLDGTLRARDFPSAWRIQSGSTEPNVEVQDVEAPMLIAKGTKSAECLLLRPFKGPAIVNAKDIEIGDTLVLGGKQAPSIAALMGATKKKGGDSTPIAPEAKERSL